jgi:hypothetical protein
MKRLCILLAIVPLAASVRAAKTSVAPTNAPSDFAPRIRESTYAPEKKWDPFLPPSKRIAVIASTGTVTDVTLTNVQQQVVIDPSWFRLQAILMDRRAPLVVVNKEVLELNKPATLQTESGALRVKAVEIGREWVILEVEGQKVEVRLEEATAPPKPK